MEGNGGILIVDFPSLEQALAEYRREKDRISNLVSEIGSLSTTLMSLWQSQIASDVFKGKMDQLIKSFNDSQTALEGRIQQLQKAYDESVSAEHKASSVASNIDISINMA